MKKEFKIINGDSLEELKKFPDNYFDSIVTDPPYGLGKEPDATEMLKAWVETGYMEVKGTGFMGKKWDAFVPQPLFWKEVYRVLKHGGHVAAFFGTRTYDWGCMAIRLAGFEIRDSLQYVYGSGFPKSLNVGKAIDKIQGNDRKSYGYDEDYARRNPNGKYGLSVSGKDNNQIRSSTKEITKGNSKFEGFGTALKPAVEPIVLARKPLEKGLNVAQNVLKWGTGGINIDGCRVGSEIRTMPIFSNDNKTDETTFNLNSNIQHHREETNQGRFPANLLLSHSNIRVMNLAGNINSYIFAQIIRYFYGYTKVSDLRERKRSSAKQIKCRDEILQFGMQEGFTKKGFNPQQNTSELFELPNSICSNERSLSERKEEILQSSLQRPTSETTCREESNKIWKEAYSGFKEENGGNENKERNNFAEGKTSELERGENESSRICEHNDFNTTDGLARNGEDNATKSNIHFGTQNSNGDGIEKTIIGFGECSSYQRNKERQSSEEFSDRGQSQSLENTQVNGCGNGTIEKGEPILEVFDFDVPTEWLRYFEYTGENLGCEFKGMKKVKPSNGSGKASENGGGFSKGMFGDGTSDNIGGGFTDENGEETVEDWSCHENCPIKIMDEQSGVSKSSDTKRNRNTIGSFGMPNDNTPEYNDKGGASRFFYTAKASKSERNFGLGGFDKKSIGTLNSNSSDLENYGGMSLGGASLKGEHKKPTPQANIHTTVKPIKLMQYLAKLITPPNGKVLDPFNGSGTTGIACMLEGFEYTGIELDAEYCKISEARISAWNELEEYEDYKKITENNEDDEEDSNGGTQTSLFD